MKVVTGRVAAVLLGGLLAACSATTQLTVADPATSVVVAGTQSVAVPRSEKLSTTSFGNYEFVASKPGTEPMYGVLPLKFNGGYLALDIVLFAPAIMFNLREVYPYYEFDVDQHVVRFKKHAQDEWRSYTPLASEAARARAKLK